MEKLAKLRYNWSKWNAMDTKEETHGRSAHAHEGIGRDG